MSVKLSFIIPAYRKNHVLAKTIKSLADQSLKSWEAIFVLDGEDVEARAIINREMKRVANDFRVKTIQHGGACAARNAGFEMSKGEFVVFWDADCVIEPHAAMAWVDLFEANSQIGFIYSGYKFSGEAGAIPSEAWDPWLLRVRNFVSSCFPVRRELAGTWDTALESLQDWDFWLQVLDKARGLGFDENTVGKFLPGYAFSTELPDKDSISGKGCLPEVWMRRVDAVRAKHSLPRRRTCVSSLSYKLDGIALAKLIDADYQDFPNAKPHDYKNIVQVGFSLKPDRVEAHAGIFSEQGPKKYLFWMPDNIHEAWNEVSFNALNKYSILLNSVCTAQFVEDKTAADLMKKSGFDVQVLPMPMRNTAEIKPFPKQPRFAVDVAPEYGKIFSILDKSLPDIRLDVLSGTEQINDFTGIVHFYPDRTLSPTIKRALLAGRHVISNVQSPFAGYLSDNQDPEQFITAFVDRIRAAAKQPTEADARAYYDAALEPKRLMEVLA